jgi:hypothetical protein
MLCGADYSFVTDNTENAETLANLIGPAWKLVL